MDDGHDDPSGSVDLLKNKAEKWTHFPKTMETSSDVLLNQQMKTKQIYLKKIQQKSSKSLRLFLENSWYFGL